MSHFIDDSDYYDVVTESRPCTSCLGDMRKCRGIGCNGMFSVSRRARPLAEVLKIKAERQRQKEDEILLQAEQILKRRAQIGQP